NLDIRKITKDILWIHQIKPPFFFSCCDGLLVLSKTGRNKKTIALDLNIEPKYVNFLNDIYGPVSNYVCSHGHLDHTCHVHAWEELGAKIHAPCPEADYLLDLQKFYKGFGFDEKLKFDTVKKFANSNGFQKCNQVNPFNPGESLKFEGCNIDTLSFSGHSKGHIAFFLPKERIFHISCMGFDKPNPQTDGFGPWYGFKQCSISQYREDINKAKVFFLNNCKYLTSSHSYIVKNPNAYPFEYMKKKIQNNQEKVNKALILMNLLDKSEKEAIDELLKIDLFFPKKKLKGVVLEIYSFWESWIIRKHIEQNEDFKKN
ncbi:MAG: MBL fold metallo-hydrolase, partial [Promethearchaeota archaeon]